MKIFTSFLFIVCLTPLLEAGPRRRRQSGIRLPDYMLGDWKMESSEGFDNYMWELSVDWFTRQIANALYPLHKVNQADDGTITYDTITTFKSGQKVFKINEPFEDYTLDKRYTTTTPTLDGNKLIWDQVPDPSTGYLTTRQVREFLDTDNDGVYETMLLHLSVKDKPRADSTRVYKRVE